MSTIRRLLAMGAAAYPSTEYGRIMLPTPKKSWQCRWFGHDYILGPPHWWYIPGLEDHPIPLGPNWICVRCDKRSVFGEPG